MRIRILHTSYVINFLNVGFNTTSINNSLEIEIGQFVQKIKPDENLGDWEIAFKAIYNNSDKILIFYKTRSELKEKRKEIVIHIPIPRNDAHSPIDWGVPSKNLGKLMLLEEFEKYAVGLDVNYSQFTNRQDYIIDCLRRGIRKAFEEGFSVNRIKVKLKD